MTPPIESPTTPPWIPHGPPLIDGPPLPPLAVEPKPPRPVPAPGTLSTGLLGLVALMLTRLCYRRRQR